MSYNDSMMLQQWGAAKTNKINDYNENNMFFGEDLLIFLTFVP